MSLIRIIGLISNILSLCIVIDALSSWFPNINRYSGIMGYIAKVSDSICGPIRDAISKLIGYPPIDFSPVIAIFLINFVYRLIVGILLNFRLF